MSTRPASSPVVVAVLTYRRPHELARLLPHVVGQAWGLDPPARVLLIDNDPAGSGRDTLDTFADRLVAGAVDYVHEPHPGIAAARNRALVESRDAEALVFIDDDEQPAPGWLNALVQRWQDQRPCSVTGPLIARFDTPPSDWVTASQMFETRRHPDGATLRSAASNNLLLDLQDVHRLGLTFNEAFGLTGGEDTEFARRLVSGAGRIIWCQGAAVIDYIPTDRATRHWVLRREFRAGTSFARVEVGVAARARRPLVRAALMAKGLGRCGLGLAELAVGTVRRSIHHRARGACVATANLGLVVGALGYGFVEYDRSRGETTA